MFQFTDVLCFFGVSFQFIARISKEQYHRLYEIQALPLDKLVQTRNPDKICITKDYSYLNVALTVTPTMNILS